MSTIGYIDKNSKSMDDTEILGVNASFAMEADTANKISRTARRRSSIALDIIHKFQLKKKLEQLENKLTQEKNESKTYRMPFMSPDKRKNLESAVLFNVNSFIKNHAVKVNQVVLNNISLGVRGVVHTVSYALILPIICLFEHMN